MSRFLRYAPYASKARVRTAFRRISQPASLENLSADVDGVLTEVLVLHEDMENVVERLRRIETLLTRRA
jgi:hypothetical protein